MANKPQMPKIMPPWVLFLLLGGIMLFMFRSMDPNLRVPEVGYTDFIKQVETKQVSHVRIDPADRMLWGYASQTSSPAVKAEYVGDGTVELLRGKGANVVVKASSGGFWTQLLSSLLVPVIILILFIFLLRKMQSGGAGGAMSFGKSKATLATAKDMKKYSDLCGMDPAVEEVRDIERFLKNPAKFRKMGARIPKGVLFVGPPGCGKTLLARAVAGEAGVPFFSISGSDFVEMFVGVGASRVRDMFDQGRRNGPCIIFIDEIDAVGRQRGAGLGGGHDEREQTLNQLLVEMDGFEADSGVIVIAATNRPDVLDPALLRPGRFDRQVVISRPDYRGRLAILKLYLKRCKTEGSIDLEALGAMTEGFSGADIENLVNEAVLFTARHERETVVMTDFNQAIEKILMGSERPDLVTSPETEKRVAVHEIGHTLTGLLRKTGRFHKVTIVPRGRAGGFSLFLQDQDSTLMSESQLRDRIMMTLGGRVAELIVYSDLSTGASNDLKQATQMADDMVRIYGMGGLGPVSYEQGQGQTFLGRDFTAGSTSSEGTAREIEVKVREMLLELEKATLDLLKEHEQELRTLSTELVVKKTIDRAEMEKLRAPFKAT